MVDIWFAKVKPDAVIPTKREEDAGYDIFLCFEEDYIKLEPHETRMLPTGIASACDSGYYFQIQERGSTGSKGIAKRCGVIDSGYRGEWFLPMTNLNDIPLYFAKPKMKDYFDNLAETERFILYYTSKAASQAVLLPVPKTNINEVSYEELMSMASERMAGALGSSGK
ncbi:MAG: dUTP pyrophosphatase [Clostridia bacterium]|nr:dUTP pyrophosphatase [Clostridia bacterium]